MLYSYRMMNKYHVNPEIEEAARRVMDFCMADLGLEPGTVALRWFGPADSLLDVMSRNLDAMIAHTERPCFSYELPPGKGPLAGLARHGSPISEIIIDLRLPGADVERFVAHELRHVWQHRTNFRSAAHPGLTDPAKQRLEDDAEEYAERAVQTYNEAKAKTQAEDDARAFRVRYAYASAQCKMW